MALQKTIIADDFGDVEVPNAYIVAEDVRVPKRNGTWEIACDVRAYASEAARDAGAMPMKAEYFSVEIDLAVEMNSVAWLYEQLKLEDWLEGAVDA